MPQPLFPGPSDLVLFSVDPLVTFLVHANVPDSSMKLHHRLENGSIKHFSIVIKCTYERVQCKILHTVHVWIFITGINDNSSQKWTLHVLCAITICMHLCVCVCGVCKS